MLHDSGDAGGNKGLTAPRDPVGVTESANEPDIDFGSYGYRDMISRSLLKAYIGGSITHEAGAAPIHLQSYAYRSYESFKFMFALTKEGHEHKRFTILGFGYVD
ncbi:hypothetical protein [Paenibacillus sp. Z3-2]